MSFSEKHEKYSFALADFSSSVREPPTHIKESSLQPSESSVRPSMVKGWVELFLSVSPDGTGIMLSDGESIIRLVEESSRA